MNTANSPWHGRRVLVTDCTGFLGGAVTSELIRRHAHVVGLARGRSQANEFARDVAEGHLDLIHGRVEDTARLHAIMAVHEVGVVFHLADSERGLTCVRRAAALYHSHVPVITARPALRLRIANEDSNYTGLLGIARFGQLFGPSDHRLCGDQLEGSALLGSIERHKAGESASRDFVFVRDAARACLVLAETVCRTGHAVDRTFRSGWEFTDATMASLFGSVLAGRGISQEMISNPCHPHDWRPEGSLQDALRETVEWFKRVVLSNQRETPIGLYRAA